VIQVLAELARSLPSTYTAMFNAVELAVAAIVVRDPVSVAPDEALVTVTVVPVDVVLVLGPDGRCAARPCPARNRRDSCCS
jgi:hypothetical protein